ncbi:MAG: zf-HC2 domain-containing protein [Chloroflexi bacterium]|nr:MAG: zf-HC2 domain-containing protein [Chloroflexota bacterium]
MTLMSRSCRIAQDQIVAVLAGSVDPRDRRALDAHAARCYRCADALRDAVATHVALGRAFAPLRAAHTLVAPGRVRLALRPAPVSRGPFAPLFGLATRLAEGTVALGVSAFILSSAVAGMWVRIGRYAPINDLLDPSIGIPRGADDADTPEPVRESALR